MFSASVPAKTKEGMQIRSWAKTLRLRAGWSVSPVRSSPRYLSTVPVAACKKYSGKVYYKPKILSASKKYSRVRAVEYRIMLL